MSEPIYFVIERRPSGEVPMIYYDRLPERFTRKAPKFADGSPAEPPRMIYSMRLDRLPDTERWLAMGLDQLYATYVHMRERGTLVQNIAGL